MVCRLLTTFISISETAKGGSLSLGQLCGLISGTLISNPKCPPRTLDPLTGCVPVTAILPNIEGLDGEDGIFSSILWSVPKKRTSHSKKRLRMQSKWLKPIQNYTFCHKCGNPKLLNVLCGTCLKETLNKTAAYRRKHHDTFYSGGKKKEMKTST